MTIDQTQPRAYDLPTAEYGFIGALLIRPSLTGEAAAKVQPEDLLSPKVKNIYVAMLNLWGRGIEPTNETIVDELTVLGRLDAIGGKGEIGLVVSAASSTYPDKYIPAILKHSYRRRLTLGLRESLEIASDPAQEPEDAHGLALERLTTIEVPNEAPSEAVDLPTFCAGEDAYDWLIPHLVERGDRVLVVATEGGGKTMLTRQLSVCAAIGVHPFGGEPFDPMRVLMVDLENPPPLARRKLRPMYNSARRLRPYGDHTNLSILCKPGGIDVTRRADARWLTAQLTHARPDLVVLGPLYKLFGSDDNWEKGARTVTAILDDLRERLNFGLVMETHAPQSPGSGQRHLRPVGSSLWLRWPEFIVTFAPLEASPDVIKVSVSKGRDERYWPHYLKREGPLWPWTPCRDPEKYPGAPFIEAVDNGFDQREAF